MKKTEGNQLTGQQRLIDDSVTGCNSFVAVNTTPQVPPSPLSMVPPLPPQGLVGCDHVMRRISELMALGEEDAADVPPIALCGMAGIGKTTLAIVFSRLDIILHRFPDGVLWTAPGPNPAIRLLLDAWGRALGLDLLLERDEAGCRDRLRAALYQRRVLIVVNDVWEVSHGKHFVVAGPQCRTLFTTREPPIAHTLAGRDRTLQVDILKPEDALVLLHRLAPEAVAVDEENAKRLCERLGFLPLALILAGRFLAEQADVPSRVQLLINRLIEQRETRLHLLQSEGRLGLDEDQAVSLQAILGMSVARLNQIHQDRFAMLSVFGGEPLTWEIDAAAVWGCSIEEAEAMVSCFIQRGLVEKQGDHYWVQPLMGDYAAEMLGKLDL